MKEIALILTCFLIVACSSNSGGEINNDEVRPMGNVGSCPNPISINMSQAIRLPLGLYEAVSEQMWMSDESGQHQLHVETIPNSTLVNTICKSNIQDWTGELYAWVPYTFRIQDMGSYWLHGGKAYWYSIRSDINGVRINFRYKESELYQNLYIERENWIYAYFKIDDSTYEVKAIRQIAPYMAIRAVLKHRSEN